MLSSPIAIIFFSQKLRRCRHLRITGRPPACKKQTPRGEAHGGRWGGLEHLSSRSSPSLASLPSQNLKGFWRDTLRCGAVSLVLSEKKRSNFPEFSSAPEICACICGGDCILARRVLAHAHTSILNRGMNSGAKVCSARTESLAFVGDYTFFMNS